ncbi:PH domain-containing protein [Streptomyces sp. NPDC101151]|uniref:PH domain-containing protein n=1 Tax=Streptomyces sp. NPDC101151 TaxID=3366115 RepID=UPI0037F66A6B
MYESGLAREYRRRRKWPRQAALLSALIVGNAVFQTVRSQDVMPHWWMPAFSLTLLAGVGWRALYELRAHTLVSADGITQRGAVRARSWAWPDIYDIRIEATGNGSTAPRRPAYLYDFDGRRHLLPHLNDWQLDDPYAEVADLRTAAWRHGMACLPRPEVEQRILRRAGQRKVWTWVSVLGVVAVLSAGFVIMVS